MKTTIQGHGYEAEQLAATYLQKQGYAVLAQNYAIRAGEIDIIVKKAEVVAFVEVKMRTKHYFTLSQVVNSSKQRKIISTALHYAARHKYTSHVLRFDVILIEPDMATGALAVTHIPNAFTAPESYL